MICIAVRLKTETRLLCDVSWAIWQEFKTKYHQLLDIELCVGDTLESIESRWSYLIPFTLVSSTEDLIDGLVENPRTTPEELLITMKQNILKGRS